MNDNTPSREAALARLLMTSVVVEQHLTVALPELLDRNGGTPEFKAVFRESLAPILTELRATEAVVIAALRDALSVEAMFHDALQGTFTGMESYADEFQRLANTTAQMKLAADFSKFVSEVTRGKEPEKQPELDLER